MMPPPLPWFTIWSSWIKPWRYWRMEANFSSRVQVFSGTLKDTWAGFFFLAIGVSRKVFGVVQQALGDGAMLRLVQGDNHFPAVGPAGGQHRTLLDAGDMLPV